MTHKLTEKNPKGIPIHEHGLPPKNPLQWDFVVFVHPFVLSSLEQNNINICSSAGFPVKSAGGHNQKHVPKQENIQE